MRNRLAEVLGAVAYHDTDAFDYEEVNLNDFEFDEEAFDAQFAKQDPALLPRIRSAPSSASPLTRLQHAQYQTKPPAQSTDSFRIYLFKSASGLVLPWALLIAPLISCRAEVPRATSRGRPSTASSDSSMSSMASAGHTRKRPPKQRTNIATPLEAGHSPQHQKHGQARADEIGEEWGFQVRLVSIPRSDLPSAKNSTTAKLMLKRAQHLQKGKRAAGVRPIRRRQVGVRPLY